MANSSTVRQIFELLWKKKAWWLVPMVLVFVLLGGLFVFLAGAGSALSPFIYAMF